MRRRTLTVRLDAATWDALAAYALRLNASPSTAARLLLFRALRVQEGMPDAPGRPTGDDRTAGQAVPRPGGNHA